MTWTIKTNDQEDEALFELAEMKDLPAERIFIQALRVYQAIEKGHYKLVETDPMPSPGCGVIE